MKKNIIISLISFAVGLAIAIICFATCQGDGHTNTVTKTDTVIIHKVIHHKDSISIPKPYASTVYKTDTMPVDTVAIIAEYYTENRYNPGYKDSNIEIRTDIAVFGNKLKDFHFEYDLFQKEKIITKTITETKIKMEVFSFQIGGGTSYNLKTKKFGGLISAGVDIQRSCIAADYDFINQTITANYKYKILQIKK